MDRPPAAALPAQAHRVLPSVGLGVPFDDDRPVRFRDDDAGDIFERGDDARFRPLAAAREVAAEGVFVARAGLQIVHVPPIHLRLAVDQLPLDPLRVRRRPHPHYPPLPGWVLDDLQLPLDMGRMHAAGPRVRRRHLAEGLPQLLLRLPAAAVVPQAGCAESLGSVVHLGHHVLLVVRVVREPELQYRLPIAVSALRRIGALELPPPLAVTALDRDRLRSCDRRVDRAQPQPERRHALRDQPGGVEGSAPVPPTPAGVEVELDFGPARRIHPPVRRRVARAVLVAHGRQPHGAAAVERGARNRRPAAGFDLELPPLLRAGLPPFHDVPIDRNAVLRLVPCHDHVLALVSGRSDLGRYRRGRRPHRLRPPRRPFGTRQAAHAELVPAGRQPEHVGRAVRLQQPPHAPSVHVPLQLRDALQPLRVDPEPGGRLPAVAPLAVDDQESRRFGVGERLALALRRFDDEAGFAAGRLNGRLKRCRYLDLVGRTGLQADDLVRFAGSLEPVA